MVVVDDDVHTNIDIDVDDGEKIVNDSILLEAGG